MKSILQIGPISYVGGVSVHIQRLTYLLKDKFNFKYIDESPKKLSKDKLLNIRSIKDQPKILNLMRDSDVIHIHSGNCVLRVYFMLVAVFFNKKFIVTLHSMRLEGFKLRLTNHFLTKACRIIAVSEEIKLKLPKKIQLNTELLEAFLSPQIDNEPELPTSIETLIKDYRDGGYTVLAANAFRIRKLKRGELYGLDQCVKVAEYAKNENYRLHIIFVIGTVKEEDRAYLDSFLKEINDKELSDFITVFPSSLSFIKLINEVDVVLRPTLTDGDALTIREALFMNKNVIASNVVKRPGHTSLYETANAFDLYSKIKELRKFKNQFDLTNFATDKKNYLNIYSKIYTECNNSHKN